MGRKIGIRRITKPTAQWMPLMVDRTICRTYFLPLVYLTRHQFIRPMITLVKGRGLRIHQVDLLQDVLAGDDLDHRHPGMVLDDLELVWYMKDYVKGGKG